MRIGAAAREIKCAAKFSHQRESVLARHIGKESNSLEDVESGLIHEEGNVYTEYPDPRRDEWEVKTRPALNKVEPGRVAKVSGLSIRTIIYARTGRRRPRAKNQERLAAAVRDLVNREDL